MNKKGQGAIEYLLIIAAAILIVAIVILVLTGALNSGQDQTSTAIDDQNAANAAVQMQLTQQRCDINHDYLYGETENCCALFPSRYVPADCTT